MEDIYKSGLLGLALVCTLAIASANTDKMVVANKNIKNKIETSNTNEEAQNKIIKDVFHNPMKSS